MAEFHDWLNRQVFTVELVDGLLNIAYRKQDTQFLGDDLGWKEMPVYEIRWFGIPASIKEIVRFRTSAIEWLNLPLDQLSKTYFSGEWEFASEPTSSFRLTLQKYEQTPSKVDWFTANFLVVNDDFTIERKLHIDQSALQIFVDADV